MSDFSLYFAGIGAPKCGTTWVAKILEEHPELCLSRPKEPAYFLDYTKVSNRPDLPMHLQNAETNRHASYSDYFVHCKQNAKCGEFTTNYFYDPEALRKILMQYPSVKMILVLRNPIERTLSEAYHVKDITKYQGSIAALLRDNPKLIERSQYSKFLKECFSLVSENQLKVVIYDDIVERPASVVSDLYDFLEVSADFDPPSLEAYLNTTYSRTSPGIKIVRKTTNKLYRKIRSLPFIGKGIHHFAQSTVAKTFKQLWEAPPKKTKTEKEVPSELFNVFNDDIEETSRIIGRDLSQWHQNA